MRRECLSPRTRSSASRVSHAPSRPRDCQWLRTPSKRTHGHCARWTSPTRGRCIGRAARHYAEAPTTSRATTWCSRTGSAEPCPRARRIARSCHVAPKSPRWMPPAPPTPAVTRLDCGSRRTTTEILRHRDIAELTAAERAHLAELIAELRPHPATRPALRMRPSRRGRVDPRRTVRHMLAAGGEPVRPRHHRKATRPRRIVLLLDVSGSMSPYADALLRFAHVVARANPAHRGVLARHPHDPAVAGAAHPRSRTGSGRRGPGGARLGRRHQARRDDARVPRPLGPTRPGPWRGRGDLLRRLGARRPDRCSRNRWLRCSGSPMRCCG